MTQPLIKLLLTGAATAGLTAAALTIRPSSHDFGEVPVLGAIPQLFVATIPRETADPANVSYNITGPDASDFGFGVLAAHLDWPNYERCITHPPTDCGMSVVFKPRSVGPKRATLVVTHIGGDRVTAALKGTGVLAICTHTVVPCNYALHYSGVVSWAGEDGYANVDVVRGVASCNAAVGGGAGLTSGPGLIGVEFDLDEDGTFYRITVACPTRYPPEPARPAELGHDDFGSYKKRLGMTIAEVNAAPPRLYGRNAEAGDIVSWNLCPHSQYRPAPRDSLTEPHDPCP